MENEAYTGQVLIVDDDKIVADLLPIGTRRRWVSESPSRVICQS